MSSSSSHVKIPLSFQTIIHYEPKYRALICLLCHHAIEVKATEKHLMHNHRINWSERVTFEGKRLVVGTEVNRTEFSLAS